ncbi:hypothetical protein [Persephonella sp.]
MNLYQVLVRIFIALSVIISLFSGDIEYSTALTILSVLYIFAFLLTPNNTGSKYIFLIVDIFFITLAVYLTGYTYLALLVIPLFSEFVMDTRESIYFLILSVIPVMVALYVSNFSEFMFIPVIAAGFAGIAGLYRTFYDRERYFRQLKNEMENLYIKNISFQEFIDREGRYRDIYTSLKEMRKNKHPVKIWIYDINEKLGTDGIIYFDIKNRRCYSTGKAKCTKEILQFIDAPVVEFEDHEVNRLLDADHVTAVTVEDNQQIYGVFVFISRLREIDREAIEIVREQLLLYFMENSDEESSDKNSGVASGGEEEEKGN